jgi:hypothetical protein
VLAEIVKLWSKERSVTSAGEPLYRQVVESISHKKWEAALLDGLNANRFLGRGSALEVLAARMPRSRLSQRIQALKANSIAVEASQFFDKHLGYLPTSGATLLQCVWLYAKRGPAFPGVAELSATWRQNYGYQFDVRDFHLLSQLSQDPIRQTRGRPQLILRLVRAFMEREYVPRGAGRPEGPYDFSDRFSKQVENLTMADLWNLVFLNEVLGRPQVQKALREMARRDREDVRSAWGGLLYHKDGQTEARVYPPSYDEGPNDLVYRPSRQERRESRDVLCRFHAHFEKPQNAERAGPTAEELLAARQGNYYGLVLTSLDADLFCAHYYNPNGLVISLGKHPLR